MGLFPGNRFDGETVMRKLAFDDLVCDQVVRDCLESAGAIGRYLLENIDWPNCEFAVLEIDGIERYPTDDFSHHIVAQSPASGVSKTPDNIDRLVQHVASTKNCLVTREFALDRPHRLIPADRVLRRGDGLFYGYLSEVDTAEQLREIVRLAQSWTFFAMEMSRPTMERFETMSPDELVGGTSALYFQAYAGDSYVEVRLPT